MLLAAKAIHNGVAGGFGFRAGLIKARGGILISFLYLCLGRFPRFGAFVRDGVFRLGGA